MDRLEWIDEEIRALARSSLLRQLPVPYPTADPRVLNFASNDYLGLRFHPRVLSVAADYLKRYGSGAGASRLLAGNLPCHEELESRMAALKGYSAALLFGSGYLANCGTIPAIVGKDDLVVADRLIHASLIDSIRLSRARLSRFRHNDPEHLESFLKRSRHRRKLIVIESVYSMDGDLAPLNHIAEIAERYNAMVFVDEAHATGVFGDHGQGLVSALHLSERIDFCMTTLSKALASYGACISCSKRAGDYLISRARTLIFSTGLPPAACGAALAALAWLRQNPGAGSRLLENAAYFRTKLSEAGLNTGSSTSHIVPVIVGGNQQALDLARRLREQQIIAAAIRPPTVPPGTARLRFSLSLNMSRQHLEEAAAKIVRTARELGLI